MRSEDRVAATDPRSFPIPIPREELAELCRRHRIRRLALFGSVLRDDFSPASDVDVLVEFEPGVRPFELLSLGAELEEALGVTIDVGTPESLREGIRDEVLAEAVRL